MNSPIILFAFNRLEAVRRTVESLLQNTEAADSDLYVFVDGPRDHVPTDRDKVGAVQEYVKTIQGFKQVTCTFAEKNKGLGASVIAGVTQVIRQYGRAIVVEDDLYCGRNFLAYMNQGLERYADNKEVFSVCGYTNKVTRPEGYSYDAYACVRSSSWGWGTWSDRWESVNWLLEDWAACEAQAKDFNRWGGSDCYGMLRKWHEGKNQSWAIRFSYSQFVQGKVAIFPMVSKVINEGFNNQGTNCHGWSRFKSDFDASDNKVFQWPAEITIHPSLLHEALSYHTIWERLYSRVMNLFYCSSTDNQSSLNVNDSVIEPRMCPLDNCQSADIELADTNLNRSTLISVVIPLYNKADSIATALDRVLAQTYQDFEVVVVDDGSTDDAAAIVEQYTDPRIRLIRQKNAGVSAARNRGIEEAKGEYVAFLDADDQWMPEFLEEIVALQKEFPECRAQATSYVINTRGEKSSITLRKMPFQGERGVLTNYFEVASCSHPPVWTSALCIERNLLQEIGGFPLGITSGEDLLTWARIAVRTQWAYSLRPLAQYNVEALFVDEKPGRLHDKGEVVSSELIALLDEIEPSRRGEMKKYISHWYKMCTSVYMRLGEIKNTWKYGCKSLRYNIGNYKVYLMMLMVLLPSKMQKSIKKKYAGRQKGKLLFFTSDYKIGQSSLLTDQLMALYKSELDFVAVSGENEQEAGLKERIEDIGIDVRRIEGLDVHANFMGLARQIADIISKEDIRCVHVQNNWQILLVVFVKFILLRRFGLKIVYTLHGFRHNSPVKSVIARIIIGAVLLLFANRVICMSTYLKRKFYFLGKKAVLIPLGISDEYFLPEHPQLPDNGLQMVFPAQFRYGKNQDMIIRAFAKHIQKCNDTESHLYLPGKGELMDEMMQLTLELGIADRVSFPGFCSKQEVLQLYLKCNIGVVASNSETFGQCIVEPFVLGRCVVSTHVGIADDILVDGENGYFFNSVETLAEVLDVLYSKGYCISKAGCLNYAKREIFSWNNVTEQYVRIVNVLLNR